MWHPVQPLAWKSASPVSEGRELEAAGEMLGFRLILQVHQQVGQFLAGEFAPGQLLLSKLLAHAGAVIPHLLGKYDGVGKRFPFGHRGSGGVGRSGESMARRAVFGGEDLLAAAGIAGLFEIALGDEKGKQVGGGFGRQLAFGDVLFAHGGPHVGGMIPHQAGHDRGSEVAIDLGGEVGSDVAAAAVDAVTLDALLALEDLLAAAGIAWNRIAGEGGTGAKQEYGWSHRMTLKPVWKM